jgi:hypothetical protein
MMLISTSAKYFAAHVWLNLKAYHRTELHNIYKCVCSLKWLYDTYLKCDVPGNKLDHSQESFLIKYKRDMWHVIV